MKLKELPSPAKMKGVIVFIPGIGTRTIRFWSPGCLWVESPGGPKGKMDVIELTNDQVLDLEVVQ